MAKRGRPKKELSPIEREKNQFADDIVNKLKYNAKLTDEQIFFIKKNS